MASSMTDRVCDQKIRIASFIAEHDLSIITAGPLVRQCKKWPAVLSTDPDSAEYVQEDYAGNVVKYHVEFLGSPRSRLWVSAKAVQLYQAAAAEPKNLKDSLQQSFKVAMEEAAEMEHITCEERLQQCLFKPQDLLYQALSLMREIEKMIERCYSVQTSTSSIHKGKMSSLLVRDGEWTEKDRVVEVGDLLIINGIIFQSGRSPEEIKKCPVIEKTCS